jgi:hypothetical protein
MPLILGANSLTGGYEIDNSLRFNSGSSDYLTRTQTNDSSNTKFNFSIWIKRSTLGVSQVLYATESGSDEARVEFNSSDQLFWYKYNGSSFQWSLQTNRVFRDVSAWYHINLKYDSTQGTSSNRLKMYINGVEETSFSQSGYPSSSENSNFFQSATAYLGCSENTAGFFDGYMAEYVILQGQALDPTSFGEFDEDSGIWKPIDVSGLTFGTNGFYLDFEDSAALGDDVSGNGNDFTVNNLTSIDQTTDTPTNNFATANPLHFNATIPSAGTLSDGNLTFTSSQGGSAYPAFYSTIGASQGKWYAEFKVTTANSAIIGIGSGIATGGFLGGGLYDYAYYYDGTFYNNGSNQGTQSSYTDGDIISVAMDLDNNKIYVAKDNVWQHSGDPSAGTGGFAITAPASNNTGTYLIAYGDAGGGTPAIQGNFGNPPFAITTGNADANGYGNFEYAVPSGYYALNTKNLAEYG